MTKRPPRKTSSSKPISKAGQPKNVIFWGAGATAALGIRTTARQEDFIRFLTGADDPRASLAKRVAKALDPTTPKHWHRALIDLITILGDSEGSYSSITDVTDQQIEAMRPNWQKRSTKKKLQGRIIDLRLTYDWPALKSVVSVCPGSATERFRLNDLFNLLDMHIPIGLGFRAPAQGATSALKKLPDAKFIDARRLIGAKNALLMILVASFYVDYQVCIDSKRDMLAHYYDFAKAVGKRMQEQGETLSSSTAGLDQPSFYQGDVAFVSLNYDPIALWVQFCANRALNKSPDVPSIGTPPVPLHLFHDFGHLIPARRIAKGEDDWPWYPLNEGGAQRLNKSDNGDVRVRLTKFLFPHGCLCWRECPDCGKLSSFHGDEWELSSAGLFPPPPLLAFDRKPSAAWIKGPEREQRERGSVDARKCLHCGTLTYTQHTQAIMQSSFKPRSPSFIEEIQRELRATTMQANHIIFMGYSLPADDVTYRAFFAARRQRRGTTVRCTVVSYDLANPGWYGPASLDARLAQRTFADISPVNAARDIFGKKNVRFYGGGIPDVFLDRGKVTNGGLEKLLAWSPNA
jgi:hypothetical protein